MSIRTLFLCVLMLLCVWASACSAETISATPSLVAVYSTAAAEPWLPKLYMCAGASAVLSRVAEESSADIVLRIGEPPFLESPAFQIDEEEILIVTHRRSPVQNLTLDEARSLFTGRADPAVQLWVYASGVDVQQVFDRIVMDDSPVSPAARMAANPQHMSDSLLKESNAVGILPRHWKLGDTRDVFTVARVPVLAITSAEPEAMISELIRCMQR